MNNNCVPKPFHCQCQEEPLRLFCHLLWPCVKLQSRPPSVCTRSLSVCFLKNEALYLPEPVDRYFPTKPPITPTGRSPHLHPISFRPLELCRILPLDLFILNQQYCLSFFYLISLDPRLLSKFKNTSTMDPFRSSFFRPVTYYLPRPLFETANPIPLPVAPPLPVKSPTGKLKMSQKTLHSKSSFEFTFHVEILPTHR